MVAVVAIIVYYVLYFGMMLLSMAITVASYILQSLGLSGVARGLRLSCPWIAWIPGASIWNLGRIADTIHELETGEKNNYAKKILAAAIASMASPFLLFVAYIPLLAAALTESEVFLIITAVVFLIAFLAIMALVLVFSVVSYICYYQVLRLCYPDKAVLFLILSIFIPLAASIIIFCCRNKVPSFEYEQEPCEAVPEVE